jgi:hypothetical protein
MLRSVVAAARTLMLDKPYHNWFHAADVMQVFSSNTPPASTVIASILRKIRNTYLLKMTNQSLFLPFVQPLNLNPKTLPPSPSFPPSVSRSQSHALSPSQSLLRALTPRILARPAKPENYKPSSKRKKSGSDSTNTVLGLQGPKWSVWIRVAAARRGRRRHGAAGGRSSTKCLNGGADSAVYVASKILLRRRIAGARGAAGGVLPGAAERVATGDVAGGAARPPRGSPLPRPGAPGPPDCASWPNCYANNSISFISVMSRFESRATL